LREDDEEVPLASEPARNPVVMRAVQRGWFAASRDETAVVASMRGEEGKNEPRENTDEATEGGGGGGRERLRFNRSREWLLRESFVASFGGLWNVPEAAVCLPSRKAEVTRGW